MTTVDFACPDGAAIPIEERSPAEVLSFAGRSIAPEGVSARHVAFDVTPARYITAHRDRPRRVPAAVLGEPEGSGSQRSS